MRVWKSKWTIKDNPVALSLCLLSRGATPVSDEGSPPYLITSQLRAHQALSIAAIGAFGSALALHPLLKPAVAAMSPKQPTVASLSKPFGKDLQKRLISVAAEEKTVTLNSPVNSQWQIPNIDPKLIQNSRFPLIKLIPHAPRDRLFLWVSALGASHIVSLHRSLLRHAA